MVDNVIILAGGAGKRLWPASLGNRPKQFLKVDGQSSLLTLTIERAFSLGVPGEIYIVTHEDHVEAAVDEFRSLEGFRRSRIVIIAEPVARNTAPALALAAVRMVLEGRNTETSLVMAADHLISPPDSFRNCVETASMEAQNGFIVPFGIVPAGAATGYGYIETGGPAGGGMEVVSFREKPDSETAKRYAASGRHFWNAGMFTYRCDIFRSELESCAPEIGSLFSRPDENWFENRETGGLRLYLPSAGLRDLYGRCPGISVDYAVMEKTGKIRMVKADFQWNDVGSWDVIAEVGTPPDVPVYDFESNGNFVYSDRPVALCGVDGLIVVAVNDRILICRKGMSQLVRDAAEADTNRE